MVITADNPRYFFKAVISLKSSDNPQVNTHSGLQAADSSLP